MKEAAPAMVQPLVLLCEEGDRLRHIPLPSSSFSFLFPFLPSSFHALSFLFPSSFHPLSSSRLLSSILLYPLYPSPLLQKQKNAASKINIF